MRRLTRRVLLVSLLGVLLSALAACSQSAVRLEQPDSRAAQPAASSPPAPSADLTAPPFPQVAPPLARAGSVALPVIVDGDEAQSYSANVELTSGGLARFTPAAGETAWAVYRFDGVYRDGAPYMLRLHLTAPYPQRLYVGIADFAGGRWQWQQAAAPDGDVDIPIAQSWQPLSGSSLYACVATFDEAAASLDLLTLNQDVAIPPPLGLAASQGSSAAQIGLSWPALAVSYPGLIASGIAVERALDPVSGWQTIANLPAAATAYADVHAPAANSLPYNLPVYYRLRTLVGGEPGPEGSAAAGWRVLANVAEVQASRDYADRIYVFVSPVAEADAYLLQARVLSGATPGAWTDLGLLADPPLTHTATSPASYPCLESREYEYRVKALRQGELSADWTLSGLGIRGARPFAQVQATPASGPPPLTVQFDASGSYDPGGGPIAQYDWDWGDGTSEQYLGAEGVQVSHSFGTFGYHSVTLTVTDEEGASATVKSGARIPGWVHTWTTGDLLDGSSAMVTGSDGRIYLACAQVQFDAWRGALLMVTPTGYSYGEEIWRFPQPGDEIYPRGRPIRIWDAAADGQGKIHLAGYIYEQMGAPGAADELLVMTFNEGLSGDPVARVWDSDHTWGGAVCSDNAGNVYVLYERLANHLVVLKLDAAGVPQWCRAFDAAGDYEAYGRDICFDALHDRLLVTGSVSDYPDTRAMVLALDLSGALLPSWMWNSSQQNGGIWGELIATDATGDIFVGGSINMYGQDWSRSQGLLLKFGSDSSLLLGRTWRGPEDGDVDEPAAMNTHDGIVDCVYHATFSDWHLGGAIEWLRFDSDGNPLHQALGGHFAVGGVQAAPNGTLYIAGTARNPLADVWQTYDYAVNAAPGTVEPLTGALVDVPGQLLDVPLELDYAENWLMDAESDGHQFSCIAIGPPVQ